MGRAAATAWRWSLSHRHAIAAGARRLDGAVCLGRHTLSSGGRSVLDPRLAADGRDARRLLDVREVLLQDRADAKVRDVGARDRTRLALNHINDSRRLLDRESAGPHDAPFEVAPHAAVREERLLVVLVGE